MIYECYAEFSSELMLLKQQRKYGLAVVTAEEADGAMMPTNVDSCGSGLDGITDEVDEYLRDLTFIGIKPQPSLPPQ
jgi:hypothetical protein